MESPSSGGMRPAPAGTAVLVRDSAAGVEVLLLRRNPQLAFHGGAWVFPGGRVDPGDRGSGGALGAARRAAARETWEEAGIRIDPGGLAPLSHWITPEGRPRRFAAWFFAGRVSEGKVKVDGGEIHDHVWIRPAEAIEAHRRDEMQIPAPTFVTLSLLERESSAGSFLERTAGEPETIYDPRLVSLEGVAMALYPGDAGWESGDPSLQGPRHRLSMARDGWRYHREISPARDRALDQSS